MNPAILGGKPVFNEVIPITKPTIHMSVELKRSYAGIFKSGMLTNSKFVQEFETKIAGYLGVKQAIAVSSCTSGLMLILRAMELKGEVIVPSFTFHATAHAVAWNGLKPVFVDCDLRTYNILPEAVEKAITSKTCAIIGVHIFGNPADVGSLERIARKHKLKLLFDAAHGFGAKYEGKNVGGSGDAESFSLSPTKLITCGEGGIVTTNNVALAKKIRIGRNYGDPGTYDCEFSGLSSRLSEFNAAVGIESLKHLENNREKRNQLVLLYKKCLSTLSGIGFQHIKEGDRHSWKDFSILVNQKEFGLSRDILCGALLAENIMVKKYFYPLVHVQKAFRIFGQSEKNLVNSKIISESSLSLPLFSHMKKEDVKKVCEAIKNIFDNRGKID